MRSRATPGPRPGAPAINDGRPLDSSSSWSSPTPPGVPVGPSATAHPAAHARRQRVERAGVRGGPPAREDRLMISRGYWPRYILEELRFVGRGGPVLGRCRPGDRATGCVRRTPFRAAGARWASKSSAVSQHSKNRKVSGASRSSDHQYSTQPASRRMASVTSARLASTWAAVGGVEGERTGDDDHLPGTFLTGRQKTATRP